jgi:hypothetical protein
MDPWMGSQRLWIQFISTLTNLTEIILIKGEHIVIFSWNRIGSHSRNEGRMILISQMPIESLPFTLPYIFLDEK